MLNNIQMGIIGDKLDIDFVISTGDNFYDDGLTGVDDPAFDESFSNIYTAPSLQRQWYTGIILKTIIYLNMVQILYFPIILARNNFFFFFFFFVENKE